MKSTPRSRNGFTLIEILIAMAIMGVVMAAVYSVYASQQRIHINQQLAVDMQQGLRAAMSLIQWEIHLAGYDPSGFANAGFLTARSSSIRFTMDINRDSGTPPPDGDLGDANENITYGFSAANDANGDGIADAGVAPLGRDTGSGAQPLAENIHAVAFDYAFDDDNDGDVDTSGGNVIWAIDSNGDGTLDTDTATGAGLANQVNINRIRAVRIWILGRTRRPIRGHTDSNTYVVGNQSITPNDGFQRLLLTATIKCRNMGLAN